MGAGELGRTGVGFEPLTRLLALSAIAGVIDLRYFEVISGFVIRRCLRHMSSFGTDHA